MQGYRFPRNSILVDYVTKVVYVGTSQGNKELSHLHHTRRVIHDPTINFGTDVM